MRRSDQFGQAVKAGVRTGKSTMVVHLALRKEVNDPPLVGFVVSKAIGNAVTRNLVKRRLRSLARPYSQSLPAGTLLVIRALPAAALVDFDKLGRDLDNCLRKLLAPTISQESSN